MKPTVYLYRERNNTFELYLGEFSTLDGLKAINENIKVQRVSISASNYKNYDWASEKEFPEWKTVKEVILFFESENYFELIDFEIELFEFGNLTTHDDGECNFVFNNKNDLVEVLKTVSASINQEQLISNILNSPGMYIGIDKSGALNKYSSFDQYLEETQKKPTKKGRL